jgi:hypothetical protein
LVTHAPSLIEAKLIIDRLDAWFLSQPSLVNKRTRSVLPIDEALELLTGIPVSMPDEQGTLPEGSLNQRVVDRLARLAELRRIEAKKAGLLPGSSPDHDEA